MTEKRPGATELKQKKLFLSGCDHAEFQDDFDDEQQAIAAAQKHFSETGHKCRVIPVYVPKKIRSDRRIDDRPSEDLGPWNQGRWRIWDARSATVVAYRLAEPMRFKITADDRRGSSPAQIDVWTAGPDNKLQKTGFPLNEGSSVIAEGHSIVLKLRSGNAEITGSWSEFANVAEGIILDWRVTGDGLENPAITTLLSTSDKKRVKLAFEGNDYFFIPKGHIAARCVCYVNNNFVTSVFDSAIIGKNPGQFLPGCDMLTYAKEILVAGVSPNGHVKLGLHAAGNLTLEG